MQASDDRRKPGLIRRLLRSEAGNIGIMTAALIVPLLGMVGSGVDFSRYFLVKQRLQLACDAGALAGRKAMNNTTFTANAKKEAERLFDANFIDQSYGSSNLERAFTETDGIVSGTASVTLDTAVLQILNIDDFDIDVKCGSKLDLPNTDIMFVLDTTGSMATVDSGSKSRLRGLQEAVKSFATTIDGAMGPKSQVRYGFVPYSSNVNVGHLLRREWMTDAVDIESREAISDGYDVTDDNSGAQKISGSVSESSSDVSSCSNNDDTQKTTIQDNSTTTTRSDGTLVTVRTVRERINGRMITCKSVGSGRNRRYERKTIDYNNAVYETVYTNTKKPRYTWAYRTVSYPTPTHSLDTLLGPAGATMASPDTNSIQLPVGNMSNRQPTNATVKWDGCIEEVPTREITDFSTMPTDVHDFDINHIPTSAANTRWRMWLPRLQFERGIYAYGSGLYGSLYTNPVNSDTNYVYSSEYSSYGWAACPSASRALTKMTVGQVESYVNSLVAVGGTYHDIGLTWGGRLISPDGIYGSINDTGGDGGAVSRHVIFMTDGDTEPNAYIMSAYGQEYLKPKRGSFNKLESQIEGRMQLICQQIRGSGATLWVVAFGPGITDSSTKTNLKKCASEGAYFEAANNTDLSNTFQMIAERVAELRLVD